MEEMQLLDVHPPARWNSLIPKDFTSMLPKRLSFHAGLIACCREWIMKQEHHFVANLYHYLFPFVDSAKPIYVSLDGEAAKNGVKERRFADKDVPDLWLTLVGGSRPVLLEAKVMNADGSITIGQGQLVAWRRSASGRHPPTAWVASNQALSEFYYWSHGDFAKNLDRCKSHGKYPKIRPPENMTLFCDIRQLALHILRTC